MTTQEEIDEIIWRRYSNYAPSKFRGLERIHRRIQFVEIKPTKWQQFKNRMSGESLTQNKVIDNSKGFLEYLQRLERYLPVEKFNIDKELKLLYIHNPLKK